MTTFARKDFLFPEHTRVSTHESCQWKQAEMQLDGAHPAPTPMWEKGQGCCHGCLRDAQSPCAPSMRRLPEPKDPDISCINWIHHNPPSWAKARTNTLVFATETDGIPETGTEGTERGTRELKYSVFQAIIKEKNQNQTRQKTQNQTNQKPQTKTETEVKFRTSKH